MEEKEKEGEALNENKDKDGFEEDRDLDFERTQDEDNLSKATKTTKMSGVAKSEISKISNKTYISHLEKQLNDERDARK